MTLSFLVAYSLMLGPLPFRLQTSEPYSQMITCRLSEQTPVIDGVLNDDCWRKADLVSDFSLLRRKGKAREQTEGMVSFDAENLYIAFVCFESDNGTIRKRLTAKDAPVWTDDCVEVYLDPRHDHTSYYHLITNLNGAKYDEKGRIGAPVPNPATWDPEWTVATGMFDGGWTVEMAIPFRSMGLSTPTAGTIWGFNMHRQEHRLFEQSSWRETEYWFHEPRNFGHLLFVPAF